MNLETFTFLSDVVKIIVVPMLAYILKKQTETSNEIQNLRTVLIGIDGKNGIRSRVMRVEAKLQNLSIAQALRHSEAHQQSASESDDDI